LIKSSIKLVGHQIQGKMGLCTRIFFINDDDTIERFPLARFERLRRGDSEERLKQYAGKRIRYALVVLEMENRRPVEIIMVQHSYLPFDSEGRIDASEMEKAASLAVDIVPPLRSDQNDRGVIDAKHKFAKRRHDEQYKWIPSTEITMGIVKAIFGKE
jgi:hypothetical protein